MYSLVLMTAMGTVPQTAEFGGFFRDLFGGGCCGGARYSCGGCSGAADYYGSCCGGCCGGFLGLGLFSRWRDYDCGCCGGFARSYGCYGSPSYSHFGGPVVSYTPMVNVGLSCQGGPVPNELIAGGKEGRLYVVNRDNLGHVGVGVTVNGATVDDVAVQVL